MVRWHLQMLADRNLAVLQAVGSLTVQQIAAKGMELFTSAEWRPGMRLLLDYRGVTAITDPRLLESVRSLAAQDFRLKERLAGMRCAIVIHYDAVYGVARMWQAVSREAPWEARLFRSYDEAVAWLEIEPADLPSLPD